jgi:two-component system sensor histidine kinase RegB
MAMDFSFLPDGGGRLRRDTLIRLRLIAIVGQALVAATAAFVLDYTLPLLPLAICLCTALALNFWLRMNFPATHRMTDAQAFWVLAFDVVELGALLYLSGGSENPFAALLLAPLMIGSSALGPRRILILGALTVFVATGLALSHLPLPFAPPDGRLTLPLSFRVAQWLTILLGVTFIGFFAWRVADEARLLASALAATEIVLEREQHLGQLDGLAAAAAHELGTPLATIALVARELDRAIPLGSQHSEDIALLRAQVERCRDILSKLTSLGSGYTGPLTTLALGDLIEDIVAPHRAFGVEIEIRLEGESPEPVSRRNAGVLYGLGNLVENAVDHADTEVRVIARWDEREVLIRIEDDGPGFRADLLPRLGEPYLHRRGRKARQGGLGLGLFIARTLLERSGASIRFGNANPPERGARAQARWSRADFETDRPESGS